MADDIHLAEVLASRMAHELAGAVGGVRNGLELMSEDAANGPPAADLVSHVDNSARIAADRLAFYRMAYGAAGRDITGLAELRALALGFMEASGRGVLDWPLPPIVPSLEPGEGKLVLLMIELALDALPRGGRIFVEVEEDIFAVVARSDGDDPRAAPAMPDDLAGAVGADTGAGPEAVSARTAHALLAKAVAAGVSRALSIGDASPGEIRLDAVKR